LAGIVLIQAPKGGGLDSTFGGISSNTFGAQRTTDFLEKGTWYLAVALLVLSLASALYVRNVSKSSSTSVTEGIQVDQPVQEQDNNFVLPTDVAPTEPAGEPITDPE